MSGVLIPLWTGAGILVGSMLVAPTLRLLANPSSGPLSVTLSIPALTAFTFAVTAWRFGASYDLVPYSVLASVGVPLGVIDALERRLPRRFLLPSTLVFGALLLGSAAVDAKTSDLFRALAGMAILVVVYLGMALLMSGGLGAGDVKLGGLLGLALGWLGWNTLLMGTLLGWLTAALTCLLLRATGHWTRGSDVPLGTFLLLGALMAISIPS
ncbi:prepilin peptidase [Saccharothrix xinjiangensis]|uniref:Prepilin peptidase n=1 Tax=Saccharothrix xinjiangensis TaxID=204798 RepID=A0ABV9YDB9_9PSEU